MRKWKKIVAMVIGLIALWFPLTWFFFGSAHPCGMLNYRMRERDSAYAWLNEEEMTDDIESRIESNIKLWNNQRYRKFSPVVCLWQAITWRWNPASDEYYQTMMGVKLQRLRGER